MFDWSHRGCRIVFPYEPYESQKKYTELVVDSAVGLQNALLESPTGTGKTLALLAAAVAWIRTRKGGQRSQTMGMGAQYAGMEQVVGGVPFFGGGPGFKVIYSSRTHSQLAQVVSQLKTLMAAIESKDGEKAPVKSVVLGSRDQLCVNPKVKDKPTAGEKIKLCGVMTKARQCEYYNNFSSKMDSRNEMSSSGGGIADDGEICDIEDLVKKNTRQRVCPYYTSRELSADADLVFVPYNYLLDGSIRATLNLDLRGSVVILDEAHNVTKTCEESASFSFDAQDVALAIHETDVAIQFLESQANGDLVDVDSLPQSDVQREDLFLAKEALMNLEAKLVKCLADGFLRHSQSYSGDRLCDVIAESGLSIDRQSFYLAVFQYITDLLAVLNTMGTGASGRGLTAMTGLLRVLYSDARDVDSSKESMRTYYRLYVEQCPKNRSNSIFNLWCFHPGFSMKSLQNCGISGTLKPLSSFTKELSVDFHITFSGPHIIKGDQVLVRTLPKGSDGTALLSTFQNRSNAGYLKSLGQCLLEACRTVPDGMLVFFPSYAVLDNCVQSWRDSGLWDQLIAVKCCFVEPRQKDAFNRMITEFRKAVKEKLQSGSCLFAVCRGKVAEGIDFSDDMARAVVLTGIPFPNLYDPRVKLKKEYIDSRRSVDKTLFTGNDWYKLEAYRAINQAIGRVIRHKNDFGAILFLDRRFADKSVSRELSDWIKNEASPSFEEASRSLRTFFGAGTTTRLKEIQAKEAKERAAAQAKSLAIVVKKRPAAASSSSVENQKPAKQKKIVISKASVEATTKNILSYKATNIVTRLKERLDKKDLVSFKQSLKVYKCDSNMGELLECLRSMYRASKLDRDELGELRDYIREEDTKAFDNFLDRLSM